jgi:hypothetical protein
MDLLRLLAIVAPVAVVGTLMWASTLRWRSRQRARNAPLRSEIEVQVCLATTLKYASILRAGVAPIFGGWLPLLGPNQLIVGTGAFIVSTSALGEFVFRGRECSISFSQAPSRFVSRDWIIIARKANGRPVQLAITHDNLPAVWQALAGTGAAS